MKITNYQLPITKKGPARQNVRSTLGGFTILETLVAVMILTFALDSLFTLVSGSLYSSQYARNEITATYLAQEAVDFIRNDRDTTAGQNFDWYSFLNHYGMKPIGTVPDLCFTADGCSIEPASIGQAVGSNNITACSSISGCPMLYYDSTASKGDYYTYSAVAGALQTTFNRQIIMSLNTENPDELDIIVRVNWKNGNVDKTRILRSSLLPWQ